MFFTSNQGEKKMWESKCKLFYRCIFHKVASRMISQDLRQISASHLNVTIALHVKMLKTIILFLEKQLW